MLQAKSFRLLDRVATGELIMPSSIGRPHQPTVPTETQTTTTDNVASSSPVTNTSTPATPARTDGFDVGSRTTDRLAPSDSALSGQSVLRTMFAPYDPTTATEVELIDEVIAAKQADPRQFPDGENPYTIHYAVYNLRNPEIIQKLAEAHHAGVDVQVLIEDHQLSPDKTWNTADEQLRDAGFSFSPTHKQLNDAQREELDLIGIQGSGLMHLKTRLFSYPDPTTGQPIERLMTGSMNPGDSASNNDETLHLSSDPQLISRYRAKYDAVLNDTSLPNEWKADAPVNVLFTPATQGPQAADKILEWIDQEDEAIFLSVFSLRNVSSPQQREDMLQKLKKAQDRGVEVIVITDKKQSDGRDLEGNKVGYDDYTDQRLSELGIPTYECINESGQFNAMHTKYAIFGLDNMKVVTDCGNWTQAALGSKRKAAKNDESYLFIDSQQLDNNATGMRYLSNFLRNLRKYEHQQSTNQPSADELFSRLSQLPNWPKVSVDFDVVAETYMGQDVYITGNHEALGNWTMEGPGLKLHTNGQTYPDWSVDSEIRLPFGLELEYKVVKRNPDGHIEWEPGDNQLLIIDPVQHSGDTEGNLDMDLHIKDRFGD
jgi:hypothetical protein